MDRVKLDGLRVGLHTPPNLLFRSHPVWLWGAVRRGGAQDRPTAFPTLSLRGHPADFTMEPYFRGGLETDSRVEPCLGQEVRVVSYRLDSHGSGRGEGLGGHRFARVVAPRDIRA